MVKSLGLGVTRLGCYVDSIFTDGEGSLDLVLQLLWASSTEFVSGEQTVIIRFIPVAKSC